MLRRKGVFLLTLVLTISPAYARGGGGHGGHGGHGGGSHGQVRGHAHSHTTKVKTSTTSVKPSRAVKDSTVHVKGYVTKEGTRVSGHDRTVANHSTTDNWTTKGNVNPETGVVGTKPPGGHKRH